MTEPGPAQKSVDAYRTISEVAADLKLPQHVLRFWETRFTQVKPLKRAGGRRFYRPEDVDLLRAVKTLLYGDGYTIKGVQRILREQGPKAVAALAASPSRAQTGRAPASVAHARDAEPIVQVQAVDARRESSPRPVVSALRSEDARAPLAIDVETTRDTATRLRAVLADLGDCVQLLASVRAPSR